MIEGVEARLKVLLVGGTGAFGERLVAGLLATSPFDVIVAGRDTSRIGVLIGRFAGYQARLSALRLDVRHVTAVDLKALGAFAVADAAGPFQGGDYRLARAAIEAGLHYVDLADARDFVAGFAALDAAAKAAGVVALTGASSTPALSNAVLDDLTAGWRRISRVEIAIAPGNRASRGLSVIQSILSYAGRPVRLFTDGAWLERPGWGMMVRSPLPGLGKRWLSLVETPDLDIVPRRFRVEESAVFRAGLELPVLHLGLWAASELVRLGLVRSLLPAARLVRAMAAMLGGLGTDRGGMFVEAEGYDVAGHLVRARWWVLAEAGDGPSIPTLPALAVLRAMARGSPPAGARACAGELPLADMVAEFTPYRITSERSEETLPDNLYQRVLGAKFSALPEPIRSMHDPGWRMRASGAATVDGPVGPVAAVLAVLFGFPRAGENVAVELNIVRDGQSERWERTFGGRRFASLLSKGAGPGQIEERFGPLVFELDLLVNARGVAGMPVRRWRLGIIPMPGFLAPVSLARETVDEAGRFSFDVELKLPLGLGRLVRYRGWLVAQG